MSLEAPKSEPLKPSDLQRRLQFAFFFCIPSIEGVYKTLENNDIISVPTPIQEVTSIEDYREGLQDIMDTMAKTAPFERLQNEWEYLSPHMRITSFARNRIAESLEIYAVFGVNEDEMRDDPYSLFHILGLYPEDNRKEGAFSTDPTILQQIDRDLYSLRQRDKEHYEMRLQEAKEDLLKGEKTMFNDDRGMETLREMIEEIENDLQLWQQESKELFSLTADSSED